jgi:hypothetical protein
MSGAIAVTNTMEVAESTIESKDAWTPEIQQTEPGLPGDVETGCWADVWQRCRVCHRDDCLGHGWLGQYSDLRSGYISCDLPAATELGLCARHDHELRSRTSCADLLPEIVTDHGSTARS